MLVSAQPNSPTASSRWPVVRRTTCETSRQPVRFVGTGTNSGRTSTAQEAPTAVAPSTTALAGAETLDHSDLGLILNIQVISTITMASQNHPSLRDRAIAAAPTARSLSARTSPRWRHNRAAMTAIEPAIVGPLGLITVMLNRPAGVNASKVAAAVDREP